LADVKVSFSWDNIIDGYNHRVKQIIKEKPPTQKTLEQQDIICYYSAFYRGFTAEHAENAEKIYNKLCELCGLCGEC
jgi:hypothetical protein